MAAGQSAQRDRTSGQTSLFEMGSPEAGSTSHCRRSRRRSPGTAAMEKELLGLYLSEHPLSSLADQIAQFVTAYSSDLKDESLDGQRVVIGGMVTGVRTVTTRNKDTMAVATLEDLQGTLEVVSSRVCTQRAVAPSPRARSCSSPGESIIAARKRLFWPMPCGVGGRRCARARRDRPEVAASDKPREPGPARMATGGVATGEWQRGEWQRQWFTASRLRRHRPPPRPRPRPRLPRRPPKPNRRSASRRCGAGESRWLLVPAPRRLGRRRACARARARGPARPHARGPAHPHAIGPNPGRLRHIRSGP